MKTVGVFRRVLMFGAHAYFWVLLVSGVVWSLLALLFAFGPWDPAESCYCDDVLAAVERVDWTGTGEGLTFRDGASSHATELTLRSDSAVAGATPSIVLPFDISWSPTGPHYDGPADRIGTRLTAAGADPQPVELDWYRSFRFEGVTIEVIREHRVEVLVKAPDSVTAVTAAEALAAELGTATPVRFIWLPWALSNLFRILAPMAWFGFWGLRAWEMRRLEAPAIV